MRYVSRLAVCLLSMGAAFGASATTLIVDGTTATVTGNFIYNSATDTLTITTSTGGNTIAPAGGTPTEPPTTPPPTTGAVSIDTFVATPNTQLAGGTVTVSWSVSNAARCEFRRGNDGWRAGAAPAIPAGTKVVTIDFADRLRFNMRCYDNAGAYADGSIVISVGTPPATQPEPDFSPEPTACNKPDADIPLKVAGVSRALPWDNFYSPEFWPLPKQTRKNVVVPRNSYVSLYFDTGAVQDSGGITPISLSSTDGARTVSFSTCEGDFDVDAACVATVGEGGGLTWTTSGKLAGACRLAPNTRYFVNMTFTDGFVPDGDCVDCLIALQANNPFAND